MATPDTQMNIYLNTIKNGIYGKDIREAIHDGMEKSYNDAYNWSDRAIRTANQASTDASSALEQVEEALVDIPAIEQMAEEIKDNYDEVTARIDNIIAHNNDTEGNSELIDLRTTYQGTVANSAGTAVRFQVSQTNQRIDQYLNVNPRSQVPVDIPASVAYTLLWENDSPTAPFAGQSVSFTAVEDTMELLLMYKLSASDTEEYSEMMPLPVASGSTATKRIDIGVAGTGGIEVKTRDFKVGASSVVISDCNSIKNNNPFSLANTNQLTIADPASVSSTDNTSIIPVKIYAVQHTLNTTLQVSKDSELVDARIGADGTVYDTLGEAIRTQVAQYVDSAVLDAINGTY